MMRYLSICRFFAVFLVAAIPAAAQQLPNGNFESGGAFWTNFPLSGLEGAYFMDADGDGDLEMTLFASNLVSKNDGLGFAQDFSTEYVDLNFGISLTADLVASNLNEDIRLFSKIEFKDTNGDPVAASALDISGELSDLTYATGDVARLALSLVKQRQFLTNELAVAGLGLDDIGRVRATLFLLRFDTNATPPTGVGLFDNVSLGLVSRSYNVPLTINGDFEHSDWWWRNVDTSVNDGWIVDDVDGDGDKELQFLAAGLTNNQDGRVWVQDLDASLLDFTPGIRLTSDLGASNLTSQFKVFSKMEFIENYPPQGGDGLFTVSGEFDPAKFATNNESRMAGVLAATFDEITNALPTGKVLSDIRTLRTTLFLLATASGPADGFGWFDHVHLEATYRDQPESTAASKQAGDEMTLTWGSEAGAAYRVQQLNNAVDFRWSNVPPGTVIGEAGNTTVTNDLLDPLGFFRVIREY